MVIIGDGREGMIVAGRNIKTAGVGSRHFQPCVDMRTMRREGCEIAKVVYERLNAILVTNQNSLEECAAETAVDLRDP